MAIGPYSLDEQLGRGAFSIVYRARHRDGRRVALKVLDEREHDGDALERFLREARVAARLVDDSFPRIHDIGADGPHRYIAMDLIEGTSLDDLLRSRGRLDPAATADLAVQLARALSTAHAIGIVHRDIKPGNLIRDDGGKLQLLDFGLSHVAGMQSISEPGVLVGTIPYMSPEQLLGERVDGRSDIFSASAVLYELLTGRRPFPGDRFETVSHAILNVSPRRLAEHDVRVPEAIERAVFTGLKKRPTDRYADAGQMLHDWELISLDPLGSAPAPLIAHPSVLDREGPSPYTPLVGRDGLLEVGERRLGTIAPDGGCVIAMSGEAGVGKSRLLETLGERAAARGLEVLETSCRGGSGTRPYQAWADLMERYVDRRGLRTSESIHAHLESLGLALRMRMLDLLLRTSDRAGVEEVSSTRGLWEALLAFWRAAAAERPLVLALDDLERADPLTLQFLGYLGANLREVPLIVICALREDDVPARPTFDAELAELVTELRRADRYVPLSLGRLSVPDVIALVRSRFGELEGIDQLVARVHAESDGNPLYVVETLKLLESEGRLVRTPDAWIVAGQLREIPIPEKVADLIRQRLARVDAPDREFLEAAAVAGETFPAQVLADCFESTQLQVLRRLRRLEQRNGIVTSTGGGFRFTQSRIREYVLDGLSPELRRAYHRSVAHTYAALYRGDDDRGDDDRGSEIADHYIGGGEPDAAVPYLERAGDRSFRLFANEAALETYERARALVEREGSSAPPSERSRLARKIASVEMRLSRLEEAILTASVALRAARRTGDPTEVGEVQLLLSEAQANRGDEDHALASVRRARASFESAGNRDALARTLDAEGNVLQRQGRHDDALELYGEALALRESLGLPVAVARSHYRIGSVLKRLSRLDESLAQLTRAREVLEESGERITAASTSGEIGSVHFMMGDFDAAATEYERCLDVMRASGERRRLGIALVNAGSAQLFRGNLNRARSLYRECLAIRLDIGDEARIGLIQTNLAAVFRHLARYREAVLAAHDGVELTRELRDPTYLAEATTQSAWIRFDLGDLEGARGWFERALEGYQELGQSIRIASREVSLAELAVAEGDHESAKRRLVAARSSAGDRWRLLVSEERLVLAEIAAGSGDPARAVLLAEEAVDAAVESHFCARARTEARALQLAVRAGGDPARRVGERLAGALGRVQRARLRGLELALRLARAELLSHTDAEAARSEMTLALAVADSIIRDVPPAHLAGWASRSGYRAAVERLEADTCDERVASDARERLEALVEDGAASPHDPTMTTKE